MTDIVPGVTNAVDAASIINQKYDDESTVTTSAGTQTISAALDSRQLSVYATDDLKTFNGASLKDGARATVARVPSVSPAFYVWDAASTKTPSDVAGVIQLQGGGTGRWLRVGSDVPAFSPTAGVVVSGLSVIDLDGLLRVSGVSTDASFNDSVFQAANDALIEGGEILLPRRGRAHFTGGINLTKRGMQIRGRNNSPYAFWMQFDDPLKPAFTATISTLRMEYIYARGPSNTYGVNPAHDFISFNVPAPHDADAVFQNLAILYFRDIFAVKENKARNIKVENSVFSNSRRVFSYELVGDVSDDIRGFEFYDNRYHSIGERTNTDACVFYANPASNLQEVIASGGLADDCVDIFQGFAAGTFLHDINSARARRSFADIDSTGSNQASNRRLVQITGCSNHNVAPTGDSRSTIRLVGSMLGQVSNFIGAESGGHGIEIASGANFTKLDNIRIDNTSQIGNEAYSGFYVASGVVGTKFGGGNVYHQDRISTPTNKAKAAVENLGTGTVYDSIVEVDGVVATAYIYGAEESRGKDPAPYIHNRREAFGTAPPTTGKWRLMDIMWNTAPTFSGKIGWVCVGTGTPGTWRGFGAIDA